MIGSSFVWNLLLVYCRCITKILLPYAVFHLQMLFEQDRWNFLVDTFKQDFCKLYGMTLEPLLNIYLQAGLTALKTPYPSHDYLLLFSSVFYRYSRV